MRGRVQNSSAGYPQKSSASAADFPCDSWTDVIKSRGFWDSSLDEPLAEALQQTRKQQISKKQLVESSKEADMNTAQGTIVGSGHIDPSKRAQL